jgi:hypothetical protein
MSLLVIVITAELLGQEKLILNETILNGTIRPLYFETLSYPLKGAIESC